MTVDPNDYITPEVAEKLVELRGKMENLMRKDHFESDEFLYRFLKARNFDVKETEAMLHKALELRQKYQSDTIFTEYTKPEVLEKYIPFSRIGYTKDGSPLCFSAIGNIDMPGIRRSNKMPNVFKYFVRINEELRNDMMEQGKKLGKYVPGMVCISDLRNFNFAMATDKKGLEHLLVMTKLYQECYPETLKASYIINVSPYFAMAFSILKSVMDATVLSKIHFLGENYQSALLEIVDADVLPAFLGGNRTDPDGNPRCESIVSYAGIIPDKYFINKNKKCLHKSPGVKKLIVPRASFSEIELVAKENDSIIEWEFETKCRDIGFGLFHKEQIDDGENISELVPLMRMDTDDFSETGMYKCEKAGTYVIVFDNSYSWVRSKEIYYKTKVLSPQEHEQNRLNAADS